MGSYFSVQVPEWEIDWTSKWRAGSMFMHWAGDGDNAKLSMSCVDEKGTKIMSLVGGTFSPSAFKITKPLPALIHSPGTRESFVSDKRKMKNKKPLVRTIRSAADEDVLPLLVRHGADDWATWDTTTSYVGALPDTLTVQSDGTRVRLWRGTAPEAAASESRRADLLAAVDLEWARPKKADGRDDMCGARVYTLLWAPAADEWAENDRCLCLALLTDLFWSNGDMSLHFGGRTDATESHPVAPMVAPMQNLVPRPVHAPVHAPAQVATRIVHA